MNGSAKAHSHFYGWLSRGRVLSIFAVLATISQISVGVILHRGLNPLDLFLIQTTLSKAKFLEITGAWDGGAWQAFYAHYWVDFLHPFLYGLFLASAIAYLLRKQSALARAARHIIVLPLAAGACDQIENVCQLVLARNLPDFCSGLFFTGAIAANIKWALAAISIAAIVALVIRRSRLSGSAEV